jgi:hypothetical protein
MLAHVSKTLFREWRHRTFSSYLSGSLSNKSIDIFNKKFEMLITEFSDMQNDDAKLPVSSRQGVGLLLALRPSESTAFQQIKRSK